MKIKKAIEILTDLTRPGFARTFNPQDASDAQKLGIEALKAVEFWNHKQLPQHQIKLPGETEE